MSKLIFYIAFLCALCGTASAQERSRIPIAVADGNGVVRLTNGQQIRGYPPYAQIWGNFPLKDATAFKCDKMHLAETRKPRFCKRNGIAGRTCQHLECDR